MSTQQLPGTAAIPAMVPSVSPASPKMPVEAVEPIEPRLYRMSVEQYHELANCPSFSTAKRVELLEGYLIEMTPIVPEHAYSSTSVEAIISPRLPPGYYVRTQGPVTLSSSEPQPDNAVVRGARGDYRHRHPGPADIQLLIEVSDSTVRFDRLEKAPIYAGEAIPHYWIVNLVDRQVEVYGDPHPSHGNNPAEYRSRAAYGESDRVPLVIGGQQIGEIAVKEFLP